MKSVGILLLLFIHHFFWSGPPHQSGRFVPGPPTAPGKLISCEI